MLEEKYEKKHGGQGEDDDGGRIEEKGVEMKRISRRGRLVVMMRTIREEERKNGLVEEYVDAGEEGRPEE
jgi:hypothetical protein